MADDLILQNATNNTLPIATLATKDLGAGKHAGLVVFVDPVTRANMARVLAASTDVAETDAALATRNINIGKKDSPAIVSPYTANSDVVGLLRTIATINSDSTVTVYVRQSTRGGTINVLYYDRYVVAATTDTMLNTGVTSIDGAAGSSGLTSVTVTALKRARFIAAKFVASTTTGHTVAVASFIRIRTNSGGAPTTASPIVGFAACQDSNGVNFFGAESNINFGASGIEFAAGTQIGCSCITPGYVATTSAPLISGFIMYEEYTP